ncbi:MAG TPA: hypothetical protein VMZ53_21565, partial [Kofleriaceae bacterium]|nr:hypothetical protein [Kofleriaceae bacterium]
MARVDKRNDQGLAYAVAGGGTIGAAWGGDYDGAGVAFGMFAGPVAYEHEGCRPLPTYSVMIGVRSLGGLFEYFVLPKAS